jgi:hypothetical protein
MYVQKASLNLTIGLSLALAGGAMVGYSASPDAKASRQVWIYTGIGFGVSGIVLNFIAFRQLHKAGRLMHENKRFGLHPGRDGFTLSYRF